jgi:hypothetical protein
MSRRSWLLVAGGVHVLLAFALEDVVPVVLSPGVPGGEVAEDPRHHELPALLEQTPILDEPEVHQGLDVCLPGDGADGGDAGRGMLVKRKYPAALDAVPGVCGESFYVLPDTSCSTPGELLRDLGGWLGQPSRCAEEASTAFPGSNYCLCCRRGYCPSGDLSNPCQICIRSATFSSQLWVRSSHDQP